MHGLMREGRREPVLYSTFDPCDAFPMPFMGLDTCIKSFYKKVKSSKLILCSNSSDINAIDNLDRHTSSYGFLL
jgi:hypothetical protein